MPQVDAASNSPRPIHGGDVRDVPRAAALLAHDPIGAWLLPKETIIVVVLAVLATVRVWIFSAAFPFWNNVDEPQHFDAVLKYSEGRWPHAAGSYFDPNSAAMYVLYNSPEYFQQLQPGQGPLPAWQIIDQVQRPEVRDRISQMTELVNSESNSWPSYYVLAGGWYRLGKILGQTGKSLLYWLRFLSAPLYGLAVFATWWYVRRAYAANMFLRLGTPLLLMVFPQDVFYGINADVLSPVVGACALAISLRVALAERSWWWYLAAGLTVSLGVLIKATNCVLVVPLLAATLARLMASRSRSARGVELLRWALAWFAAVAPVVWWLARNRRYVGDWFASREKAEVLGWQPKPMSDWFDHPIFTPRGAWTFLHDLLQTFWRGELYWAGERIAWPAMDQFFIGSSLLFLCLAAIFNWRQRKTVDSAERLANFMNLVFVVSAVLLLAALSLPFNFGPSHYPSADHPYFTSGRLISGVLASFCVLYLQGLQHGLRRLGPSAAYYVLAVLICVILFGEVYLNMDVFRSPYNWFHITR